MRCEACGADSGADDAEIERLKALITDLAVALEGWSQRDPVILPLIVRAMEVTKCHQ
jgi:hypothetical protein